jgi:hypothetical protein
MLWMSALPPIARKVPGYAASGKGWRLRKRECEPTEKYEVGMVTFASNRANKREALPLDLSGDT